MAMTRKMSRVVIIVIGVVVIAVAASYGVKKFGRGKGSATAADSTADSTAVAGKKNKGKKGKGDPKKVDPIPVEVACADYRDISSFYHTTATLQPEREVEIISKTAGETTRLFVEEGDRVTKGQLLCQLEEHEQHISFDEARIDLEKKEQDYQRLVSMYEEKLVSDTEYAESKYQYELAKNRYEAAKLRYEYTRIRAPFTGIITQRFIDEGENVSVGMQLFRLADVDPLLVNMFLPENEMTTIREGQIVYVSSDNDPGQRLTGQIVRCSPEVDNRTGTVKVTAETHGSGMPGSFVRLKIVTDTHGAALTIPRRGVMADAGDQYVYLAEADTVRKQPVEVGYQDDAFAEILSGLAAGDSVIVVGQGGIKIGAKIRVLPGEENKLTKADTLSKPE